LNKLFIFISQKTFINIINNLNRYMGGDTKKVSAGGSKGSSMQAAVSGTEAIRTWDDHRIGIDELCKRFRTNKLTGLTSESAK
jgi:hypothetical protein